MLQYSFRRFALAALIVFVAVTAMFLMIRAVPGAKSPGTWHSHDLDFQMVYVTQGWVVFEYEGEGEHILRKGSCVLQPPGIKHREVRHSDDMELIEVISPADFPTHDEDAP